MAAFNTNYCAAETHAGRPPDINRKLIVSKLSLGSLRGFLMHIMDGWHETFLVPEL
jgi:hypothetical protein